MKTLIVLAHPSLKDSKVNKRWIQEAIKYPDKFTIHDIYGEYPQEIIDVKKEQTLIEAHGSIVLQFPIYWFNCPPLMKKWLDDVFTDGWAYGKGGEALKGRNMALAVSAGIGEKNYTRTGKYHYSLKEILVPFEMTFDYCGANYKNFVAFYDAEFKAMPERIEASVPAYIDFIASV